MRLDKLLAQCGYGTRREVHQLLAAGAVSVNGKVIRDRGFQVDPEKDDIQAGSEHPEYQAFHYVMLNKPSGYVCSDDPGEGRTVYELITGFAGRWLRSAGRLDKDTEGLLLLSDDGDFIHRIIAPRSLVEKEYHVWLREPLRADAAARLGQGLRVGAERFAPARLSLTAEREAALVLTEGRYHEVKRMMLALDNEVVRLERVRIGSLRLDPGLARGEYRLLRPEELAAPFAK